MSNLKLFIDNLCGKFNNDEQINTEIKNDGLKHPRASHICGVCNDKIKNLPEDFNGYFLIEESYYEQGQMKNILPHLFLFTLNENDNVVLTSYDIPKEYSKEEFRNDNDNITMDYNELKVSAKFTPMEYIQTGDSFSGTSVSNFTPVTTFTFKETIEGDTLYVSEIFETNGKMTFGFPDPIIYKKIK